MYHRLLLLTLIINSAEMYLSCAPGEVAKSYTFTCIFSKNESYIYWKKNTVEMFACQDSTCEASAPESVNIYEATRSSESTTLKINAVTTQSGGDYSCYDDKGQIFFNCSLRVYAKPDTVTCQDPELQIETNEVAVVCTVLRVYPNPICQFSWFINNTESRIIQKSLVEYSNLTESGDHSYFNQRCSFKVPARNFTRGKHQFQLLAYPDVTGQDNDIVYGKHSTQTSPKYIDPVTPGSEKSGSHALDVGPIVGGIAAAVLVIILIVVIVYLVKRKGAPCRGKKHQNTNSSSLSIDGSDDIVTVDNSTRYNLGEKSEEVVVDNYYLYNMNDTVTVDISDLHNLNRKSQEVEIDNSDLYNLNRPMPGNATRGSEYTKYSDVTPTITTATSVPLNTRKITIENSDLHNLNRKSQEVEIDNSDLYNMNRPMPGNATRGSEYTKYSDVTTTITTATSVPLNTRKKREDTNNPCKDVNSGNKNKPKPPAAPKPKPVAQPKPQSGKQEGQQEKNPVPDQTYAMVVKFPKLDKPFTFKENKDDFFLDPSQQPAVPEKNFENPYEDSKNEKRADKKLSDKKNKKANMLPMWS